MRAVSLQQLITWKNPMDLQRFQSQFHWHLSFKFSGAIAACPLSLSLVGNRPYSVLMITSFQALCAARRGNVLFLLTSSFGGGERRRCNWKRRGVDIGAIRWKSTAAWTFACIVFLTRWHFRGKKPASHCGATAISGRRAEQYADLAVG